MCSTRAQAQQSPSSIILIRCYVGSWLEYHTLYIHIGKRYEIDAMNSAKAGRYGTTWFLTGSDTVVCYVPCTPGGVLAKKVAQLK